MIEEFGYLFMFLCAVFIFFALWWFFDDTQRELESVIEHRKAAALVADLELLKAARRANALKAQPKDGYTHVTQEQLNAMIDSAFTKEVKRDL